MKRNALGISLLLIAIIGSYNFLLNENKQFPKYFTNKKKQISPKKKLFINQVWHADFQRLIKSGSIPKAWTKINQIIFIPTDPTTEELIKYLKAPVTKNEKGEYRLEISVMSHQSENEETKILLQHNIIDNENDNTIWELNRTYNLNK